MRHLAIAIVLVFTATAAVAQSGVMRVHFIDVGQGDATLFEFPCGAMLVDTGSEKNPQFQGNEALEYYLDEFFARRTDLNGRFTSFVLTHPHMDHTRNVDIVTKDHRPANVVTNGREKVRGTFRQKRVHRFVADSESDADPNNDIGFVAVTLTDIPEDTGLTNAIIDPFGCADITVLWGSVTTDPGWDGNKTKRKHFDNPNNHSVVLRVDFGQASVLLTGDLETDAIDDLVERYEGTDLLDVDVYQAGHHGAENGTTDGLIGAMTPELAVISMGPSSRETQSTAWQYGHPNKKAVKLIADAISATRGAIPVKLGRGGKNFVTATMEKAVYATGWDGNVVLESGSDGIWRVISPGQSAALLNVNTATVDELIELPGIGPVKANAIVQHRTQNGPFTTINQLDDVPGIGPATISAIRPFITTGN